MTARPLSATRLLAKVRKLCLGLPEATEKEAWGSPTFRVRGKKMFVMFLNDHHGDGRIALWCSADLDTQHVLIEGDPDRYFVPPYMGPSGWVGMRLEDDVDWEEVAELVEDAYRRVAPQKLVAALDA